MTRRRAALVVVVAACISGCASVKDHVDAGRLAEACVLLEEHRADDGFFAEWFIDVPAEDALVGDALRARVTMQVDELDDAERNALLHLPEHTDADADVDFALLRFAWLGLKAAPGLVVHEHHAAGTVDADAIAARLARALPPLIEPKRPLYPPGPLVVPPPAELARAPGGTRASGLIDAFVTLVTLPFRIIGEVTVGVLSIPFDLFGLHSPFRPGSTTSSSSSPPTDRRAGEAILPPEAWEREKQRLISEHEVAVIAVNAKRAARDRAITAIADRLRERCVLRQVDQAVEPCRRLVLVDGADVAVSYSVGVVGSGDVHCAYKKDLGTHARLKGDGTQPRSKAARPPPSSSLAPPPSRVDVPILDAKDVAARLRFKEASAERLAGLACRVEVKGAWRRLLKGEKTMQVRVAAGHDEAHGATVAAKAVPIVEVGVGVNVDVSDHVKVVIGTDLGYVGGVIGVFTGALPLVLDGPSVRATCR